MKTLSVRLPDCLYGDLQRLAEKTGKSRSDLVREALVEFNRRRESLARYSALSLLGELVGSVAGPENLSTNKSYLDDLGR